MTLDMLVFKDAHGHYYVLSRDAWEQAQVPDARRHEVDQLLAGRTSGARARKVSDLSNLAPSIRGGAVSAKIVGSFRMTSPISGNPASHVWSAPPTVS
jgi:hypothetical protein